MTELNKTPVSTLQELMTKKRSALPVYELIHDGGGTHVNSFTYEVSCDSMRAIGTGTCKKDAKQKAAQAMLDHITNSISTLTITPTNSPNTSLIQMTPPSSENFSNYVGQLQEYCATNKLSIPEYIDVEVTGPQHNRVFKVQCALSSFTEIGLAPTKKKAKHEAAKKMLDRIKQAPVEKRIEIQTVDSEKHRWKTIIAKEIAKAKYLKANEKVVRKTPEECNTNELTDSFKCNFKSETLERVWTKLSEFAKLMADENKILVESEVNDVKNQFEEFFLSYKMRVSCKTLVPYNNKNKLVAMQLDGYPGLVEIGCGDTITEATGHALAKLIDCLMILLK